MDENLDHLDEEVKESLRRYQDMLKNQHIYYFDVFEFEHIIDFYLSKNDFKNVNKVIKYALSQHPGTSSIMLKKAQAHINKGFPLKAMKLLKKLEKLESSNHTVFYLQGAVYCSLGDINTAIEAFDLSLLKAFEAKNELLFDIGMTLKQISRFDLSNNYLLKAYQQDKKNKSIIYELAHNYEKLNEDDSSASYYKEYIKIDPFSVLIWYSLGLVYSKLEQFDLAVEAFEYAIAIDPEHIAAYYQKGVSLYYGNKIEESIQAFQDFREFDKDNVSAIFHIGEAYSKLEQAGKAEEYFNKAIELDPQYADAWYGKAFLYFESKNFTDSLHSIRKAIKIDNEDPDFWYLTAIICRELDFIDESEKAFKKTLELDDSDPKIWIEYSKIDFGKSKIYKTINILSEANELFENDAEINYLLAAYLAQINNISSAIFHLKLALSADIEKLESFRAIYKKKHELIEKEIELFFDTKQKDS